MSTSPARADRVGHLLRRGWAEAVGTADWWAHRSGARSLDGLRLPDFLGIGAQKAGSTWLHANLGRHPQLFLPPEKELHYFDWFRVPTLRRYAARFAPAGGRLAGEITPGYSALPPYRIRRVRALLPEARVLLLLRDPVDRAWSQLGMDARKQGRSPTSVTAAEARARLDQSGAGRRSDLVSVLRRWDAAFGDQLWVGRYEDISTRPEALLASVFAHLGVDDVDVSAWPLQARFNPGAGHAPPDDVAQLLEERLGGQRESIRVLLAARGAGPA